MESPNRAYSIDLLDFLVSQGLSKDQILHDMMNWFNADDVVACLEQLATDYDIPLADSIESCDVINCNSQPIKGSALSNQLVSEWYTSESYPECDPKRLADMKAIDWEIEPEDAEYILMNEDTFPDLTAVKSISYFEGKMQDWVENEGYDGGYIVIYNNGAEKDFAWYGGEPELHDVTEDATYMFGNQKYRDSVKNEPFAHAMSKYNERIAEETYGNKWDVDHDIYSDTDVTCSDYNLRNQIVDELWALLQSQGNGAECKGINTRKSYWLWQQETGPGYAIYFDDGNVWRDRSQDNEPIYFSSLEEAADWLIEN